MPLFDYKCDTCKHVKKDCIVPNTEAVVICPKKALHGPMKRQFPNASGPFYIKGFRSANGYARKQPFKSPIPGIRVEITDEGQ